MTKSALLSTTLSLVALQLGSRLFSFGLNQLLLRSTTPQAFGVATIQFDVLRDTVLFLIREGIRGAVVRTRSGSDPTTLQRQSRLLPVLLSPLVLPAFYAFSRLTSTSKPSPSRDLTLTLYAFSTIIELLSEPSYLVTLTSWETLTSTRVRIEGLAVVGKALGTLVALHLVSPAKALESYGWGQVIYSLTLLFGLEYSIRRRKTTTTRAEPKLSDWSLVKSENGRYFDPEIKEIGWALTKQSIVKQVLTEGDKLAVSKFGKIEDLGSYAVALNYGSLVARIIFQPLEESSRLYFSSLSRSSSNSLSSLTLISTHLSSVLTFYSHLSLILIFLVPPYITPLLSLLLGSTWSTTASPTLKAYIYSLPFLAFNGLLEAGFQSLANDKWLKRGSLWMGVCTIAFSLTVYVTMREDARGRRGGWGSRGLIVGNCVNMAMRIGFSSWFLFRYLENRIEMVRNDREKGGECQEVVQQEGKEENVRRQERESDKEEEEVVVEQVWKRLNPKSWVPSLGTFVAFYLGGKVCDWSETRWSVVNATVGKEQGRGAMLKSLGEHVGIGAVVGLTCLTVVAVSKRRELGVALSRMRQSNSGGIGHSKDVTKKSQ